jgi:uracil-DNA glycosylase family 4
VQFSGDDERVPLSPLTRSGALLAEIERVYPKTLFYKTNLVKCLPLAKDKIRYPIKEEMERCYTNFEDELRAARPKLVFLLGKQVASFVYQKIDAGIVDLNNDFEFAAITTGGVTYVPVHHPSFILVYKRQAIKKYIKGIQSYITKVLDQEKVRKIGDRKKCLNSDDLTAPEPLLVR